MSAAIRSGVEVSTSFTICWKAASVGAVVGATVSVGVVVVESALEPLLPHEAARDTATKPVHHRATC
jgi:hypothetical protein